MTHDKMGAEPISDEALDGLVGFTPGPWGFDTIGCVFDGHGVAVAVVHCKSLMDGPEQLRANGLLVAAAPAMHARILADRTRIAELEAELAYLLDGITLHTEGPHDHSVDTIHLDVADCRRLARLMPDDVRRTALANQPASGGE